VLCVFVPQKGVARNLALVNLGAVALLLALTLLAGRLAQSTPDQMMARIQEQVTRRTEQVREEQKQEQKLREQRAAAHAQAAAGDEEAAKTEKELDRKLSELQANHLAEHQKELERVLEEAKSLSARSLSGLASFAGFWFSLSLHGMLLSAAMQTVILAFFIRAIALTLGNHDLAGGCPRLAALALLNLVLVLSFIVLPLFTAFTILPWMLHVLYFLGILAYVWQGSLLVETCILIGSHLDGKVT
jgi:hypothetical protein